MSHRSLAPAVRPPLPVLLQRYRSGDAEALVRAAVHRHRVHLEQRRRKQVAPQAPHGAAPALRGRREDERAALPGVRQPQWNARVVRVSECFGVQCRRWCRLTALEGTPSTEAHGVGMSHPGNWRSLSVSVYDASWMLKPGSATANLQIIDATFLASDSDKSRS